MTHAPTVQGPIGRRRSGMSLIEVVVACTLLAFALTSLTGLAAKMAQRTRNVAYTEQRTATFYQEVNRVESMRYDSLTTNPLCAAAPCPSSFLVTDSVKSGPNWYVWSYVVDPDSTSATGTARYRKVTLTVTPRISGVPAQTGVIRRSKPAIQNPFNLGP